jgi:hypothetical protein
MAKRPVKKKKRQPDYQELAHKVLETIAPDAEPKAIKPAKNSPPPRRKKDTEDVERAESDGMAQPQGKKPEKKNPAAVALGRLGGLKGGKARAKKLSKARRSEIAQKAAASRWKSLGKHKPTK